MKKHKLVESNRTLKIALEDVLRENEKMSKQVMQLEEEIKRLKRVSTTDSMTELGNKMAFNEIFESAICDYLTSGKKFTIAIIDLNDLKKANDIEGHEKGDNLIKSAARVMQHTIRNNDYAFRIGGDEFAIILTGIENGRPFERRLHDLAEKSGIGLSIGWSSTSHLNKSYISSSSIKEFLFGLADSNMYKQKSALKKKALKRQ